MKVTSYTGPYIQKKDHHLYIAPDPSLADIIAHYTITFSSGKEVECEQYHIIPDASGCFIIQGEHFSFWGAMSELAVVENDIEDVEERLFVEFLPSGLYQISGKTQHFYANQRAPMHCFDTTVDQELRLLMASCTTYDEAIAKLNGWFIKQRQGKELPKEFQVILSHIQQENGGVLVKQIAHTYALSVRQLLRLFQKYIGIGPKEYVKIIRFNHLLKSLPKEAFLDTALDTGFFDQAHFNKVFKQITHVTPSNYIENLEDFYQELLKF